MCQTLLAISLGDWFSVSRKGGTGGGLDIHPKGENSSPSVGSLHKWSWKTIISPHRASMQCSSVIY